MFNFFPYWNNPLLHEIAVCFVVRTNIRMKTVTVMFLFLFMCAVEGETERGRIIIFLCGKNILNMKLID